MTQVLDRPTLELIRQMAVEASNSNGKLHVQKIEGVDSKALLVKPDGTHEVLEIPAPRRTHGLDEVAQVGVFAAYMHEQEACPVVWYDRNQIVVVCDDGTRRDRATCGLTYTDHFSRLMELANQEDPLTQRDFVRLLKYELAGCVPEALLKSARKVQFNSTTEGFGDVGKGKVSLGKEVRSQANTDNGVEFQDEVVVTCRVFTDLGLKRPAKIKCDLDVDADAMTFSLRPYPGEIEREIDEELAYIGSMLAKAIGENARLFRGTP